jgi:DNA-binding beta-propeller fold protein YncE/catechol 2,3-dioxygenase-like lactoylglutathione lyase family enzyme
MLFGAGLLAGLTVHVVVAQTPQPAGPGGVVMMNHVGINVPNINEAVTYYSTKMGYREAFRLNDENGQPRIVYLHISQNTFLELNQANADRPAGFTHYGLHVQNAAAAVAEFRKRGVDVSDTNVSDTKAILANIKDPYMGRIELAQLTPESLHYQAIQKAAGQTAGAPAQQRGGTPQTDKVPAVNTGANPYRVIRDWAKFTTEKRPWGGSNGVAIDRDGRSVWAVDRCSPGTSPGCADSTGNPIHLFDASGNEVRSFGAGMFVWPHGIHVDRDGNVWVADSGAGAGKGSVAVKFSPQGQVLLTLGKPGVRGNPPEALTDPTDVVTDPANGDVYVAESHTNVADANLVGRVSVFDRNGKFLRTIGGTGMGPGEFRTPHAIEFDSQGRLIVADRHNHRIQILTKEGKFIAELHNFGRSSGLAIDGNDVIYTADSESDAERHAGWRRGIRIGSLKDGKVTMFIPPHDAPNAPDGQMGEGIAIDQAGNLYTAEAQLRGITKYVRQ